MKETIGILQGDCIEVLKKIPSNYVDMCVTSPPYYGLRDYGVDGQIGLEETPEEYIQRLVEVFREVRRVIKDDGTLWINIGDSYAGGSGIWGGLEGIDSKQNTNKGSLTEIGKAKKWEHKIIKPKDLIGIPWMLAFALREDGWYLRQDIIWHKPNPMPESVKDRCTKSHEYIFMFSKQARYYFDAESIQEKCIGDEYGGTGVKDYATSKYKSQEQEASVRQGMNKGRGEKIVKKRYNLPTHEEFVTFIKSRTSKDILYNNTDIKPTTIDHWFRADEEGFSYPSVDNWMKIRDYLDDWSEEFRKIDEAMTDVVYETDAIGKNNYGYRNKRDVWSVTVKANKSAHFATYPEDLIEPCIKAGSRVDGIVLDPFFGSGTTGVVAEKLNRRWLGIELNPEYVDIATKRTENIQMTLYGLMEEVII